MKVAYVSFAPFVSGAERSLQVMLEWAPRVGIDPLVLCPPGSHIIPWCKAKNIPYVAVPLPDRDKWHPIRWFASIARVAFVLRRERVDVVHSNQVWSFAAVSAASRLLGIPRVCHMRDEVGVEGTRWWCKSGVDAVICISHHIERIVAPAWAQDRRRPLIKTLLNPVVVTALDPITSPAAEDDKPQRGLRPLCHVPADTRVFGFIGQIVAVKGVLELLEAVAGLSPHRRWHLAIAGRDPHPGHPYETACRRRVEELGLEDRVTFLGYLENAADFYRTIDVAVVPSLEEPLGRIPLEAASHGKPSIAFATGGLPETIDHGTTGWLVPTGDIDALRAALEKVLDDPAEARLAGARGRELVLQHCSPERYMRQVVALYADLLAAHKPARLRQAVALPFGRRES